MVAPMARHAERNRSRIRSGPGGRDAIWSMVAQPTQRRGSLLGGHLHVDALVAAQLQVEAGDPGVTALPEAADREGGEIESGLSEHVAELLGVEDPPVAPELEDLVEHEGAAPAHLRHADGPQAVAVRLEEGVVLGQVALDVAAQVGGAEAQQATPDQQ